MPGNFPNGENERHRAAMAEGAWINALHAHSYSLSSGFWHWLTPLISVVMMLKNTRIALRNLCAPGEGGRRWSQILPSVLPWLQLLSYAKLRGSLKEAAALFILQNTVGHQHTCRVRHRLHSYTMPTCLDHPAGMVTGIQPRLHPLRARRPPRCRGQPGPRRRPGHPGDCVMSASHHCDHSHIHALVC